MLKVVLFETDRHGHTDGQIGKHAKEPVSKRSVLAVAQIVRQLVNCQCERVVDCATVKVGLEKNQQPIAVLE